MRKIPAAFATLALAALGIIVPATGARASAACDNAWNSTAPGYLHIYANTDCTGLLARTTTDDSDWGDASGPVRGVDLGEAGAVLHKGSYGMAVKLYQGRNHTGDHACLTRSEPVSDASEPKFPDGRSVSSVRSHRWVWASECAI
ncbi:hypothetical protein [Streptomyces fulvorobeus]|uniref:Secreted protein n=1 Tax=Streptomyces fulvorobeus TaxID=284028 RepID=A0A7J0CF62_9ACTN|nr:hypothetical protein [Streptomyces fulvorobeus]NYE43875.1 hypothetical protein [Streptomyces fulvorobeus]GFN00367.1 hypothetical protein Sfulv_51770 [Streptomyces fulvorobeus]